jgi:tRNA-Thr(GGU) m(6)t(6)A37 methyltransferase TsaA
MSDKVAYTPIGIIHSPFTDIKDMPIQPSSAASAQGSAVISEEYREGLADLEGFSHVILLYHLHRVDRVDLTVKPFLDQIRHGVFATRAPTRPNPIGLSIVRLTALHDGVLYLENVDILDGTPLLDVKPYVPEFDQPDDVRTGWLATAAGKAKDVKSDGRFLG